MIKKYYNKMIKKYYNKTIKEYHKKKKQIQQITYK